MERLKSRLQHYSACTEKRDSHPINCRQRRCKLFMVEPPGKKWKNIINPIVTSLRFYFIYGQSVTPCENRILFNKEVKYLVRAFTCYEVVSQKGHENQICLPCCLCADSCGPYIQLSFCLGQETVLISLLHERKFRNWNVLSHPFIIRCMHSF